MNVLVTGGAGFLGAYICAALETAGHRTVAYDLSPPGPDLLDVAPSLATRFRQGSTGDADRLLGVCRDDRVEAIVHAAARLGLESSLADPEGFYQTNVMGTVNVFEAARKLGIARVVTISSNAVYLGASGDRLKETDTVFSVSRANPAAHYGASKLASEAIGMAFAEFHGVEFLALRVSAIYGFGMRSPLLVKPMVENSVLGRPTRLPTGGPMKRDYTHVLDCSRGVLLAVELAPLAPGEQRVFNVTAGQTRTGLDVAGTVRSLIPDADIEIGDRLTELEAENVKMRAPLDSTAAERVLDWSPAFSFQDGVREYIDRFRHFSSRPAG